nr:separase [Quercus suber]
MVTLLNKIADDSHQARAPFDMILRLYAAGLHLINSDVKSRGGDLTSSGGAKYESVIQILCDDGDILQNLAALLGSLGSYFHISCKENYVTCNVKHTDYVRQICSWIRRLKGLHQQLVGFQKSFSFSFASSQASCSRESTFRSAVTVVEINEAAFQLILSVPVPSQSVILAGYFYYDLCERLVSHGRLIKVKINKKKPPVEESSDDSSDVESSDDYDDEPASKKHAGVAKNGTLGDDFGVVQLQVKTLFDFLLVAFRGFTFGIT